MPTTIPIAGSLARVLGLDTSELAKKERKKHERDRWPHLDPKQFFALPVVQQLMRSHPGLMLSRYLPFDRAEGWQFDSEGKNPWLREFARLANESLKTGDAWKTWARKHRELFPVEDADVRVVTIKPMWRWIIGLGENTILETGITLHHTFGVSYIPGSSLKGMTQALVMLEQESSELTQRLGTPGSNDRIETHERLFGTQKNAGSVIFVGAIPSPDSPPKLKVDVMTPHFPQYYQGKRDAPLEVEDPTPIPFLTVSGGAYELTLTARCKDQSSLNDLDLAKDLCLAALDELGVGGKTGKGYGYFTT